MTILTDHEYRDEYKRLHFYEEIEKEIGYNEAIEDEIVSLKKEIREWQGRKPEAVIVRDDGIDGYVEKRRLPEWIRSREEGEDYFKDMYFIPVYRTCYDCTGRPFTSWYSVKEMNDGFYAYHCVRYDV